MCALVCLCSEQTAVDPCWYQVWSWCRQADQQNGNCHCSTDVTTQWTI